MTTALEYDHVIDEGTIYNFIPYEIQRLASYLYDTNKYVNKLKLPT